MEVPSNIALLGNYGVGKIADAGVSVANGRVDRHWQTVVPEKWTGETKLRKIEGYMLDSDFFIDRFNLKFVEFGNWMNQQDRQNYLYNTAISFDDLAKVFGISPDEIGLQKNLSMAFGARGQSKALAHFERLNSAIINLTKVNGRKGVLAHEYGHAFDNLIALAIFGDIRFVSGDTTRKNVDQNILKNGNQFEKWFELFFQALYYKDDGTKTSFYNKMVMADSEYWESRIEIWARFFEQYISYKQRDSQEQNQFLCRPFKYYLKSKVYIPLTEFKAALPFAEKIIKNGLKLLLNKSNKITSHGVNKDYLPEHQQAQLRPKNRVKAASFPGHKKGDQMALFNGILGATEVLSQNGGTDYNGYVANYKVLDSYDHLINKATNKTFLYKKGGLDETIDAIKMVIAKYYKQVEKLSHHLKASTTEQTAFNTWHFIKTYIKYDFDLAGMEEIRTPARTWYDRAFRSDCEDMAIFAGSIFKNLGIDFSLTIVGFRGTDFYQHIYVTVKSNGNNRIGATDQFGNKEIVIDGVMAKYGIHPDNIVRRMDINILGRTQSSAIGALGGTQLKDNYTLLILNSIESMKNELSLVKSNSEANAIHKELRKARYMVMLNGTPEREVMMHLMHVVDDVDEFTGNITFKKEANLVNIANYLEQANDILDTQVSLDGFFSKIGDAIKGAANNVGDFLEKNIKSAAKDIGKAADKIKDVVIRFNPATIIIRNAFLGLMNVNFLKLAAKIGYGYVSIPDARARGYNQAEFIKAYQRTKEVEKIFEKFGGKKSNLKAAVKKGAARNNVTFSGTSGNGLGEVDVEALLKIAGPIIAIVVDLFKGAKSPDKNESDEKTDKEKEQEKSILDKGKDLFSKYGGDFTDFVAQYTGGSNSGGSGSGGGNSSGGNSGGNNSNNNNNNNSGGGNDGSGDGGGNDDDESGTPAWVMPVVLTTLAAGGLFLYNRNK